MIRKEIPPISENLFIRKFTLAIIKSLECKEFVSQGKICIDSELVPKISKSVVDASMGQRIIPPRVKKINPVENTMIGNPPKLVAPVQNVVVRKTPAILPKRQVAFPPRPVSHHINIPPQMTESWQKSPNQMPSSILESPELIKLKQLIRDPAVFSIECLGANKPLRIIRLGQKQSTNISLNKEEISRILKKFSSDSRIPLFDGVFKVAVENLLLNAIVSEMIGSKFIIKKRVDR